MVGEYQLNVAVRAKTRSRHLPPFIYPTNIGMPAFMDMYPSPV